MKLNERTRFPHPILSVDTDDYLSGAFHTTLEVIENPSLNEVRLAYSVELDEPSLLSLLGSDRAALGVFVTCRDTYYSQLIPIGLAAGQIAFENGVLSGRVSVRPIVWARRPVTDFGMENCHEEFGTSPIEFSTGSVLAVDEERVIHVGREKLAQIETIFAVAEMETLSPGTFAVNLEREKITVMVASDIYSSFNTLRAYPHGRPITLNSVFLPAVMEVLDALREGSDQYEGRHWFRVFDAKCAHLNIDPTKDDLWSGAQRLLNAPFHEIHRNKQLLGG